MSFHSRVRWLAVTVLACTALLSATDKKAKPKAANPTVDSGSFGVFIRGQRVITEKFSVQQENGLSVVKSHLQEAGNATPVNQHSDLEMTGAGDLVRYDWTDGAGSLTVTPNNDFLLEKISASANSKPAEQPFLMPSTSAILDNNFFIHREVLAWRYLASNCKSEGGSLNCQRGPLEFGVLVPQDRTSLRVRMELVGREKINIRGEERELMHLNLMGEEFSWSLWLDDKDQFKLIRVLIPDANTEVLRD